MTVTIHPVPAALLTPEEIEPWRAVPVAVAVDLVPDQQIDPAIRPLNPPGRQPRLFDGAVRDVATIAGWTDFSVFARWVTPRGPSGAARGAVNLPVTVGGRLVTPGDLVIGVDD